MTYHDRYEPQPRNRARLVEDDPGARHLAQPHPGLAEEAVQWFPDPTMTATVTVVQAITDTEDLVEQRTVTRHELILLLRHSDVRARNAPSSSTELGGLHAQLQLPSSGTTLTYTSPSEPVHLSLSDQPPDDWMMQDTWEMIIKLLHSCDQELDAEGYACLVSPLPLQAYRPADVPVSIPTPPTDAHRRAADQVEAFLDHWQPLLCPEPIQTAEQLADVVHVAHLWHLNVMVAIGARLTNRLLRGKAPAEIRALTGFPDDLTDAQKRDLQHEIHLLTGNS